MSPRAGASRTPRARTTAAGPRARVEGMAASWSRRLRPALPYLFGGAILVALVLLAQPSLLVVAARRFDPIYAPVIAGLALAYYMLQGARWVPLLRAVGIRAPVPQVLLLNLAGQSTGLLPGGELTRALLVSEVAKVEVGEVVATITVQELIYNLLILAVAMAGALHGPLTAAGVGAALGAMVLALTVLTVEPLFALATRLVGAIPIARRVVPDLRDVRRDTIRLLRRWDTLGWSGLSILQVGVTVTMFWVVVRALDPGRLGWEDAALVYAVAHLAGAVSFSPGGLGGFEGVCIALLLSFGLPLQVGVAAALIQRAGDKGLGTVFGIAAYIFARHRYRLKASRVVRHGQRPAGGQGTGSRS